MCTPPTSAVRRTWIRLAVVAAVSAAAGLIPQDGLRSQQLPPSQAIRIQTAPGARIYIDGQLRGSADKSGNFSLNLGPGVHEIRVTKDRQRTFEQKVMVLDRDKEVRISAVLPDITGTLDVVTTPGAEISVDGKPAGKADREGRFSVSLAAGTEHRISASGEGRAPEFTTATVAEGAASTVTLMLEEVVRIPVDSVPELGKLVLRRAFARPDARAWNQFSFSPDSTRLGADDDSGWVLWDIESGRQVSKVSTDQARASDVRLSADWKYVLLGETIHPKPGSCNAYSSSMPPSQVPEDELCRYRVSMKEFSGPAVAARFDDTLKPGEAYFALAPDSRHLLQAKLNRRVALDRILPTPLPVWTVQEDGYLREVRYSPKGDLVAVAYTTGKSGAIALRDAATGKRLRVIEKPEWESNFTTALFSPDGTWLAVGQGFDFENRKPGRIRLFDTRSLKEAVPLMVGPGTGILLSYHPSGRYLAAYVESRKGWNYPENGENVYTLRIWDLKQLQMVWSVPMSADSIAFSPNGRWFAAAGRVDNQYLLRLWELVPTP